MRGPPLPGRDLRGRRVTVMGLGRHGGGVGVVRYLVRQGALVTLSEQADEAALGESLRQLQGLKLAGVHLAGHREEHFRDAELVVVNPAVPPGNRFVQYAAARGATLTSEIELFLAACPARMVGVTGTNGKSSTAAMTAAIVQASGQRVWLGGNIGKSLLDELGRMDADDWVVLELSSFQLARLSAGVRLPEIAVVTNCAPNHLDWHGTWQDYVASKQRLLTGQDGEAIAVLNPLDGEVGGWQRLVRGRFVALADDERLPVLRVAGEHQRLNARCAAAAAACAGCDAAAIERGLSGFEGLPQRLEWIDEIAGRRFYNDSQATTPEATLAAVRAFDAPLWLMLGGHDKGCDFHPLAAAIAKSKVAGVALYGSVRATWAEILRGYEPACELHVCERLPEALEWCWSRSRAGDAVVLSPACASFDQYRDYAERGAHFVALVDALKRATSGA